MSCPVNATFGELKTETHKVFIKVCSVIIQTRKQSIHNYLLLNKHSSSGQVTSENIR